MVERESLSQRCRSCVEDLNNREEWGLYEAARVAYAVEILSRVPASSLDRQLEQVVRYYHHEHARVATLTDADHPGHATAWQWVNDEIRRVAQVKRLGWSSDRAIELDDLVQAARIEIARAIGAYHFESTLRTWLQSVTARRLLRFHRDSLAEKRAGRPESLVDAEAVTVEWDDFEVRIRTKALCEQIDHILRTTGDTRLATIFRQKYIHDRSAEAIGSQFQLHPSRIRALLKQARAILAQDTGLRGWLNDDGEQAL